MPVIQPITSASSGSAYVPTSRVLTINGVAYDLTADRSWTVEVLDNLIATAPLSYDSGTNTISIPAATNSVNGYLTSADWLTFSSKQPAITLTVTGNSGSASLVGATLNIPTYTLVGLGGMSNPFSAAIGQIIYSNSAGAPLSLLGNTTTTKKFLSQTGDGTNSDAPFWDTITASSIGALSSVAIAVPTGFSVSNSPLTANGTITIGFASGYTLPTDAKQTEWDSAYTNRITSLTTTGNSGSATLIANTLNIPTYTLAGLGGMANVFSALGDLVYSNSAGAPLRLAGNTTTTKKFLTQTGDGVSSDAPIWGTISVSDVSGAIGLTALSASSPLSYNNTTGAFSIQVANVSQNGYLSSSDWTTFNSKQSTITLTTTGNSGAATFVSNTLNIPEYTLAGLGGFTNPMTSLGDMIYSNSAGAALRLAANTTTTRKYLSMLGDGTFGAVPTWEAISASGIGAVPTSRTLTINGTSFDLSADRTYSVGTVTSVGLSTTTTGVTIGSTPITTSGTITINIDTASSTLSGLLSSTDWTTFNDKMNNPMTSLGDMIYGNAVGFPIRRAGNTSTTKMFLSQTGDGTSSAAPQWATAVTSVALSMPSAFSVSGSPITTTGTLAVTGAGTASQYIRGDGQLATLPSFTSGGSSVNYYLNGSVNQGTIGGSVYYEMSRNVIIGGGTDFNRTNAQGNGLIAQFITDVNDPNRTEIPAGAWNFEMFFSTSSSGGSPSFYLELLKYDGTTFTSIANNSAVPELITSGTATDLYLSSLAVPLTTLLTTDRLVVRVYVVTSGRTITLHTENSNLCEIVTTFSGGITSINGITENTQYLAVGTSGTDFNISSAIATHTFNLPTASATNRGALSSADWTTFNAKQPALSGTGFVKISGTTISYDNSTYYLASNPSNYITLTSLSAGTGISYNNTTGVITSSITQYTDALARAAISLTTSGSSGSSIYNSTTGVLNVPTYTASGLGAVPTSRTLTINDVVFDLSANREWSVGDFGTW